MASRRVAWLIPVIGLALLPLLVLPAGASRAVSMPDVNAGPPTGSGIVDPPIGGPTDTGGDPDDFSNFYHDASTPTLNPVAPGDVIERSMGDILSPAAGMTWHRIYLWLTVRI